MSEHPKEFSPWADLSILRVTPKEPKSDISDSVSILMLKLVTAQLGTH